MLGICVGKFEIKICSLISINVWWSFLECPVQKNSGAMCAFFAFFVDEIRGCLKGLLHYLIMLHFSSFSFHFVCNKAHDPNLSHPTRHVRAFWQYSCRLLVFNSVVGLLHFFFLLGICYCSRREMARVVNPFQFWNHSVTTNKHIWLWVIHSTYLVKIIRILYIGVPALSKWNHPVHLW